MTMMSQLIATPSVSCTHAELDMSNEAVIDKLANWLSDCGFATRKQQVLPGKFNLIATIGQGSDGLILSGHTDTVPYDDHLWHSDPFAPTERDGRLYGLGSCDMKSFLAMAISASLEFKAEQYRRPLTIIATADEETTMSGARLLAEEGKPLGRYCVIGEPTGLKPIRQHKGIMMEAIRFIGASGHSSNPELGNSALEAMHAFLFELLKYRDQIQQNYHNPAFEVPVPTLNLGHIHGGDSPNRICGQCELHIDLRPLPGMQLQELRQQIRELARQTAAQHGLEVQCEMLFEGTPALDTDESSLLNRFLEQATEQASGVVAFGTEAPFYNGMGCETIVMGPGSIDQAHQPDEFLPLDQVEPTVEVLTHLIQRFCIQPE
jgi:acetylornithine deacetylase